MADDKLISGYIDHLRFTHVDIREGLARSEYESLLKKQHELIEESPFFWAWEDLDDLCVSNPVEALEALVEIINAVPELGYLGSIGAGPLESLLANSAEAVNESVLRLLENNQRFRFAFAHGYYFDIPQAILQSWIELFQRLGISKESIHEEFQQALRTGA
jgi:hypothetical protein